MRRNKPSWRGGYRIEKRRDPSPSPHVMLLRAPASTGYLTLSFDGSSYFDLNIIISSYLVDERRDEPAEYEDTNDDITQRAEVVADVPQEIPETTAQIQLATDNTQSLDAPNEERDQHGDQRNIQVVVQLTHGFDKSPAICTKHQDTIGGIYQAHTCH